mmetsp:Transcript_24693/g.62554  ORF Transcript_24693/g.62554 Transcript_24693/m.62554 type:complete len:339 (-) Transcript_24693:85-1101(-)
MVPVEALRGDDLAVDHHLAGVELWLVAVGLELVAHEVAPQLLGLVEELLLKAHLLGVRGGDLARVGRLSGVLQPVFVHAPALRLEPVGNPLLARSLVRPTLHRVHLDGGLWAESGGHVDGTVRVHTDGAQHFLLHNVRRPFPLFAPDRDVDPALDLRDDVHHLEGLRELRVPPPLLLHLHHALGQRRRLLEGARGDVAHELCHILERVGVDVGEHGLPCGHVLDLLRVPLLQRRQALLFDLAARDLRGQRLVLVKLRRAKDLFLPRKVSLLHDPPALRVVALLAPHHQLDPKVLNGILRPVSDGARHWQVVLRLERHPAFSSPGYNLRIRKPLRVLGL